MYSKQMWYLLMPVWQYDGAKVVRSDNYSGVYGNVYGRLLSGDIYVPSNALKYLLAKTNIYATGYSMVGNMYGDRYATGCPNLHAYAHR